MMPAHAPLHHVGVQLQPSHMPLVNSPSSSNILHVSPPGRRYDGTHPSAPREPTLALAIIITCAIAYCKRIRIWCPLPRFMHRRTVPLPIPSHLRQSSGPRVKFAPEPMLHAHAHSSNTPHAANSNNGAVGGGANSNNTQLNLAPLQRSKSLSSADTLTRGLASLGLGIGSEANDIGMFSPEVQTAITKAIEDPNQLNARCLMDLAAQLLHRAVEGRR